VCCSQEWSIVVDRLTTKSSKAIDMISVLPPPRKEGLVCVFKEEIIEKDFGKDKKLMRDSNYYCPFLCVRFHFGFYFNLAVLNIKRGNKDKAGMSSNLRKSSRVGI
jgi:hypothetical protein